MLATLLLPVATAIVGGVKALVSTREQLNSNIAAAGFSGDTGVFALVKVFPGQLCIVAALACIYLLRSAPHLTPSERSMTRFKLFLSLVLLFLYANPFAHTRYIFLAAFGSIAVMALRTRDGAGHRGSPGRAGRLPVRLPRGELFAPARSTASTSSSPSEPATSTGSSR